MNPLIFYGLDPRNEKGTRTAAVREYVVCNLRKTNVRDFARRHGYPKDYLMRVIHRGEGTDEYIEGLYELLKNEEALGQSGRPLLTDAWRHRVKCYIKANGCLSGLARAVNYPISHLHEAIVRRRLKTLPREIVERIDTVIENGESLERIRPSDAVPWDFAANLRRMGWTYRRIAEYVGQTSLETVRTHLKKIGL